MPVATHTSADSPNDFDARISAWVDGEDSIRPEDLDTPYGRQRWDTYHLVGDVLRSPSLALRPSPLFYARLSKAIDAEPAIVAPTHWWQTRATRVSGLAAAAVALVTWLVLPGAPSPTPSVPVLSQGDAGGLRDYLDAHAEITGSGALTRVAFTGTRP